jgi:Fur family transcriptional regulator, peroxide stress response regulator
VNVDAGEVQRRLEKFKSSARRLGIKLTHQRLEIFREVAASMDHPNAESVLRAVQPRMPTVSLDTIYRTLWLLADLGLVTTLGPRRETVRFDANLSHHNHYVCTRCGLARDFTSAELKGLRIPGSVRDLGSVVTIHIEVRGVCNRCAKAKESGSRTPKKALGRKGKV